MIRFLKSRSGATALEYSIIAGLIAIVIVTALKSMGGTTAASLQTIAAALK